MVAVASITVADMTVVAGSFAEIWMG